MPQSHGFSAWITIEGTKVLEFDVRTVNKTVTCWIPSEVGKKFSIYWSNLSVPGMTGGRVLMDGHNCDGQILARKRRPTSTFMSGINEATTSVRPFVFGTLDITDDEAVPVSNPDEALGTIDLEIWKVETSDAGPSTWTGTAAPVPQKIQERSKKAVTQQIGFGDSVDRQPVKVLSCKWTERIVTFSFKYRPLDLLRADGIAPPVRDKGKRRAMSDEDDSDAEEARMLENRLSEIRAKRTLKNPKKRKFKSEDDDEAELIDLTRPKKRIKYEDVMVKTELIDLTQPKKRIKAEVIDLT
ncbi:hypothetical protein MVEN_00827300 [Mycena venus]|uniref:DUF7918 domain-containing protein n=1 Tax=Mycena venus TaxID=2733690 RepID=A0A8H6YB68_9AGAR|nr:hypothetical protein MVEN_00827300 [Mycena venus]